MTRPRLLAAVVAWVVVVAVGSTVVWAVISRAGGQVVSADGEVPAVNGSPARHPSAPSSRLSAPSSDAGPTSSEPTSSGPASSGTTTEPAPPQRRTWQGQTGLLGAECEGPAISLVSTQPNVGYHAELKKPGPEELEVEFDGNEEQAGTTVIVTARCSAGIPLFTEHDETERHDD